jgi:GNAT superfamily N-acetyltransferase
MQGGGKTTDPITRRAESGDFQRLAALYLHLNPNTPVLGNPQACETWAEIMASDHVAMFVRGVGKELVASCTLITAPNLMRQGTPHAFLENVVTHAAFRRQGHGRAVIQAALDEAWRLGCRHVALFTGRGRADPGVPAFYAACGLHPDGKQALIAHRP